MKCNKNIFGILGFLLLATGALAQLNPTPFSKSLINTSATPGQARDAIIPNGSFPFNKLDAATQAMIGGGTNAVRTNDSRPLNLGGAVTVGGQFTAQANLVGQLAIFGKVGVLTNASGSPVAFIVDMNAMSNALAQFSISTTNPLPRLYAANLDAFVTNTLTLVRPNDSTFFHLKTEDGTVDLAFWPQNNSHGLVLNCTKLLDIIAPTTQLMQSGGKTAHNLVDEMHVQYAGIDAGGVSFSHQFLWVTVNTNTPGGSYGQACIQAFMGGTNWIEGPGGKYGWSKLHFYSQAPRGSVVGSLVGIMETNGWNLRGKLVGERAQVTMTTKGVIDYNTTSLIDFQGSSSAVAFYTTNDISHGTNYQKLFVVVRAGGVPKTLTYPAWFKNASLPAALLADEMLTFSLTSVGSGETNKMVSDILTGTDPTFVWDVDALDFFTRAGISDNQVKGAVNYLAATLKSTTVGGSTLWDLDDVIWPMAGGTSGSHSRNLKSSSFTISWNGGLTHAATGVKGNGSSGYGDLQYNTSTSGRFSATDGRIFAYVGTSNVLSGLIMSSVENPGSKRITFADSFQTTYTLWSTVINHDFGGAADLFSCAPAPATDGRGPFMGQRSGNLVYTYIRSCSAVSTSTAPNGVPNANLFLLARNWTGFAPDNFSDAEIRGASIGPSMTVNQWNAYRAVWDTYNELLGRKVP